MQLPLRADPPGARLAEALTGSWRDPPPSLPVGGPFGELTPLLFQSGGAGLAWWRVRVADPPIAKAADPLHQAFRLNVLDAAAQEPAIAKAVGLLRSCGAEPILGKGWAAARLYPASGLRPCGDIDLYVRAEHHASARPALGAPEDDPLLVDLHQGFGELNDRSPEEIERRSLVFEVAGAQVRTFGPEDHLRLLTLHFMRHGGWRALWLCDIAAALESRPPDFDWRYFEQGDPRRTEQVACAVGLAHRLLGARLDGVPPRFQPELPAWVADTVVREWSHPRVPHGRREPFSVQALLRAGGLRALRLRWPNGIEATAGVNGPFNDLPRLPFQLADCFRRAWGLAWTRLSAA